MLSQKDILKNRKVFSKIDKNMAAAFKVLSDVHR
jgi:hypothetical protein